MLTIMSRIDVAEALRRGHSVQPDSRGRVPVIIPADLPEEDRRLIADHLYRDGEVMTIAVPEIMPVLPEPTPAGVIEAILAGRRRQQAAQAEQQAHREAAVARAIEHIRARRVREITQSVIVDGERVEYLIAYPSDEGFGYCSAYDYVPPDWRAEYDRWRADLRAANDAARIRAEEIARIRAEVREAAQAAEAAERRAWIEAHGSPRLRRLLAEGIEHLAVYRDERLAVERPGWCWLDDVDDVDLDEPRNAPEEALDLLDVARATAPDATLAYYVTGTGERGYIARATYLDRDIVTVQRVVTVP